MPSERHEAPWPGLLHALRAVLLVDVAEYVRLVEQDEQHTLRRWYGFVDAVCAGMLPRYGGRLVKSTGDGLIVEFETVRPALQCAFDMHDHFAERNSALPPQSWMQLRAAVHEGNVFIDKLDMQGQAVNLTARLATLAQPGEVVVSARVCDQLISGVDADIEDLGLSYFKNALEPVQAYRASRVGASTGGAPATAAPAWRNDDATLALVPTIAVMPFDTPGATQVHAALGEIIADSLIVQLSTSAALRVISRMSTSALRARAPSAAEVGKLLGANFVLSGSCRVAGTQLIVTSELADTRTERAEWHCREVAPLHDLLQPRSELVDRVCQGAAAAIVATELRRVQSQAVPTLQGFSLLLAGSSMLHSSSRREFEAGREIFEHLIDRHPRLPAPRAWLAAWYVLRVTRGLISEQLAEPLRALDQTRRALGAAPDCSLALAMEGFVYTHLLHDMSQADACLDAALAANPSESLAWLFRSVVQGFYGDGEAAFASALRALALSPVDPMRHYYEGLTASAATSAGHWAEAIQFAQRSLRVNRNHLPTLRALAISLVETDELAQAKEVAKRVLVLDPQFDLRQYIARAPPEGRALRERYAQALSRAGIPGR